MKIIHVENNEITYKGLAYDLKRETLTAFFEVPKFDFNILDGPVLFYAPRPFSMSEINDRMDYIAPVLDVMLKNMNIGVADMMEHLLA